MFLRCFLTFGILSLRFLKSVFLKKKACITVKLCEISEVMYIEKETSNLAIPCTIFFSFSFHQFVSDHLGQQQDNEEEQKKLHHLKSLLLKHKGNKDIPEKTLIRIVDLMDQLNV